MDDNIERRKLNDLLLNNLNELHTEIRELRLESATQFRYLSDAISKSDSDNMNKFILQTTFWKVVGVLFTLICGAYSYVLITVLKG